MNEFKLRPDDEYIKLGQLLKAADIASSGAEAKSMILDGMIEVNGQTAFERGKKIREGDIVSYGANKIKVIK